MYAFEIQTNTDDKLLLRLENLDHELMQMFINDDSTIQELISTKWYEYQKYDIYTMENTRFIVMKQTKKNVILVRIK